MFRIQFLFIAIILCSVAYGNDFNPMNYGAVGDGFADDSNAVQAALNAAKNAQGGVTFPAGKIFAIKKVNVFNGVKYMRGGQIKFIPHSNPPSVINLLEI